MPPTSRAPQRAAREVRAGGRAVPGSRGPGAVRAGGRASRDRAARGPWSPTPAARSGVGQLVVPPLPGGYPAVASAAARAADGSAAAIRSIARSSCVADTNQDSNADGGRYTPCSSIAWKKPVKRNASWRRAAS